MFYHVSFFHMIINGGKTLLLLKNVKIQESGWLIDIIQPVNTMNHSNFSIQNINNN